ncbi:hypothetical protein JOS77_05130 [Chromobacterium haemolyticum]|nr:hypothetical protein JOS77_05130 [Chromobacterium haemolyticum]
MMRILMLLLCVLALPALGQTLSIRYALVSGESKTRICLICRPCCNWRAVRSKSVAS